MLKNLLGGAAVLALSGHAVSASSVFVNGVSATAAPYVSQAVPAVTYQASIAAHQSAPAVTYQSVPAATYQSAPAVTYQSAPAATYQSAPVVTHQATPVVNTHEIIVNQIPAPVAPAPVAVAPIAAPIIQTKAASNSWNSRVYVGARGGLAFLQDTDFAANRVRVETDYDDPAYSISAVAGWAAKVNNNIQYRLEAEIGYQFADADSFSSPGATSTDASGDAETIFAFANAYVDVPIIDRLSGTVGGGLGVGRVDFDDLAFSGGTLLDDDDTAFGYHLDAGLTYDVTDQIAVEALYRYTSFVDVEVTAVDGTTTEDNLDSHSVLIGARYGF